MRCVEIDAGTGAIVDIDPQPVTVTECTLVLVSPAEILSAPWAMTQADALQISYAILFLCAWAWVWKFFRRL